MPLSRRSFLTGLLAAPAIVKVSSLMPISVLPADGLVMPLPYGISPAASALRALQEFQERMRRDLEELLIYPPGYSPGTARLVLAKQEQSLRALKELHSHWLARLADL